MRGRITARQLANYIINLCIADGQPVSNLQLQKIMYLIQAYFLRRDHKPLFDEDFRAGKYGPVIPEVYREFAMNVGSPITHRCNDEDLSELSPGDIKLIKQMVKAYREYYPWVLVDKSHQQNGAWAKTYKNGAGYGNVISKESITRDMSLRDNVTHGS